MQGATKLARSGVFGTPEGQHGKRNIALKEHVGCTGQSIYLFLHHSTLIGSNLDKSAGCGLEVISFLL